MNTACMRSASASPWLRSFLPLACLVAAGCASPFMKGTPFYSGEYDLPGAPPTERVNLWPLIYFRDPVLSILWPLVELTDDHFAVRPLLSVYGMGDGDKVVNVLWPLARFDFGAGRHRVFPVFWGQGYATVFPLYYHRRDPEQQSLHDTLVPLWSYSRDASGYSSHVLWPLIHAEDRPETQAWRIWPLAGSRESGADRYRFLLWPIVNAWSTAGGTRGHAVLPFYGLWRRADESTFVSLPYSARRGVDGRAWQLVPPLFFHAADPSRHGALLCTLLGGYWRDGDALRWLALPLLSGGSAAPGRADTWLGGPLAHFKRDGDARAQHVFPFYYRSRTDEGSRFFSLPWSSSVQGTNFWRLAPLFFHQRDERGETLITPLYAQGRSSAPERRWEAVLPLLYYRNGNPRILVSPLLARWGDGSRTTLVPPLLSWVTADPLRGSLWLAGGLARWSWGEQAGPCHILPLLYRNPATGTLLSPLAARWTRDGIRYGLIPPLLSGYSASAQSTDVGALLGLFYNSANRDPEKSWGYLIPAYYYEAKRCLYTPLFGWRKEPESTTVYPLTPLAGVRRGRERGWWVFPLWSHSRETDSGSCRGSFLWGGYRRNNEENSAGLFPVFGYRREKVAGRHAGAPDLPGTHGTRFWCLPACWYRRLIEAEPAAQAGPVTNTLTAAETAVKEHGFFPLWSYGSRRAAQSERTHVESSVLLALFDYRREVVPADEAPDGEGRDYTRKRLLWRLWHYEKLNGDVSVDAFPAVTYDSRKDGFRKVSFLWRLFRYERGAEGRKLDILFLPLMR